MEKHATAITSSIPIQLTSALIGTACLPVMSILHLPVWIAFLAWAAAGWIGEKNLLHLLWKTWPPLIVGTVAGALDSLLVQWYQSQVVGASLTLTTIISMIIIFTIVFGVLWLAKISAPFAEAGAIFIGLNSYFSLSLLPHFSLFPGTAGCFVTATVLCLLGPVLYWLAELLTFAQPVERRRSLHDRKAARDTSNQTRKDQQEELRQTSPLAFESLAGQAGRQKTIELNGGSVIIAYNQNHQGRDPVLLNLATVAGQGDSSE
jgi:hypothetical protein